MRIFISHLSLNTPNILSNPVRQANMGFSPLSLSQFLSSILFLLHFHTTISSSNYSSSSHFCAPDQSLSLLQFKESFCISSSASSEDCQHPMTESWKEGTDCCLWDGVSCDLETGHVTGLYLSGNENDYLSLEPISFDKLVQNLTQLRELYLSSIDMSLVSPNSLMNLSSSLSSLVLYSCGLQGKFPSSVRKFKHLQLLDLRFNNLTGSIPDDLGQLTELYSIDLSFNDYLSVEPSSFDKIIQNLTKLGGLRLGYVNMPLVTPNSLANLSSSLSALGLWNCGLKGKLPVLNLSHNRLEGPIPGGKQFNTFNADSFEGNLGLCGFPMPKECNSDEAPPLQPSDFHDGDDSKFFEEGFGWKAVAIGYGSGFVFGVTMGYVVFRTRKPAWFLKVVEDLWNLKARRTKKNARRNGARRN
ncbi:hypothetical protein NC653_028524 [Populus alba x Populus x berolinensis]|uniref:Leucine-rich repeat-containing N-terminal plant-type domain-containing protein n=1 Tax=Populus alba x Populus x berolinensis TaxID=444605 RepID=A0AAD6LZX9_9ROSI|nr:hypothetical protein NC653_028524 [Populus alba x Populus x berolinensis]